jgi:hypothetical protein
MEPLIMKRTLYITGLVIFGYGWLALDALSAGLVAMGAR